jgi:hypothetical protein
LNILIRNLPVWRWANPRNPLECLRDNFRHRVTPSGQVYSPIGFRDQIKVMLNNDHGWPASISFCENFEPGAHVKPCGARSSASSRIKGFALVEGQKVQLFLQSRE